MNDDVTEEMRELWQQIRESGFAVGHDANLATQTVIHKTEGPGLLMGIVLGVAITTCIATWGALIVFEGSIRDLNAWKDTHNNEITTLKNSVKHLENRP